ncbi:hypothetical protein ACIBG4_38080 [Nonomuraea sp. NPDC050383]|uniref:hypothetical protein n=1 Tax=Nonomuraea sp. NPDC050383 TaxID=3364362 RepID=UPI0037A84A76
MTVRDVDADGDVGVADLAPVVAAQPDHHVGDVVLGLLDSAAGDVPQRDLIWA